MAVAMMASLAVAMMPKSIIPLAAVIAAIGATAAIATTTTITAATAASESVAGMRLDSTGIADTVTIIVNESETRA